MNADQAGQIVARVQAYWAQPSFSNEEAMGWIDALTDPEFDVSYGEAASVLRRLAFNGEGRRPRPGEIVASIRQERRAQVRLVDTSKMLEAGRDGESPERVSQWVAAFRRRLAGEKLEAAYKAEGLDVSALRL